MDRLAIVTGSSRGLGAELAVELAGRGWRVQGLSRGPADPRLDAHGARAAHDRVDLADGAALERWAHGPLTERWDLRRFERVALVNNAGILAPIHTVAGIDREALERAFRVNAVAPMWLAGFVLERRPRGTTLVADVSSGAAVNGYPGWAAYCATKAALRLFDASLAAEAEVDTARRIAVLTYAPGVLATDMQAEIRATSEEHFPRRERFRELHARGDLVPPEDAARHLAGLLEADDPPRHRETRYAGREGS